MTAPQGRFHWGSPDEGARVSHARRRARHGRIGFWYRLAVVILRPPLTVVTRRDWRGAEHLPADGGVVVVTNHVSHVDPLIFAHFLYDNGKLPRFLAKEVLFRLFFVGRVLRGAKQIPVYRESADAATAFSAAVAAVRAGECVGIYPEATLTRDPDLWPMVGKTGAARVALETGAPVIPIAQWGPQEVLPPYSKRPAPVPADHRARQGRSAGGPARDLDGRPVDAAPAARGHRDASWLPSPSCWSRSAARRPPAVRFDPANGRGCRSRATPGDRPTRTEGGLA